MNQQLPIFVYGTLKRGESREPLWPAQPARVEGATTLGSLYDLGPYPALIPGSDVVAGELWHISPADLEATLARLDGIEGFLPEGNNLYERRVVRCRNEAGQMLEAYTYLYARQEELAGKAPLRSGGDGCVRWRGRELPAK